MKYHFISHRQVRPFIWNMSLNYKGALEHVMDVHEVCALLLTDEQSAVCVCVQFEVRSNLDSVSSITGDQIWIYVTTQKPNSNPLNGLSAPCPCLKSSQTSRRWWRFFFDLEGIFHCEFLSAGQMVNQHYYQDIFQCLRAQICWRHPEWWQNQDWLIHHHNAQVHCALSVQQFLAAKNMAMFPHPSYSPDLPACDIFFFCEWNRSYKALIPRIHLKFMNNCWLPLIRFKQVNNLGVSSSVRSTEPIVQTQKGTTWMGTTSLSDKGSIYFITD